MKEIKRKKIGKNWKFFSSTFRRLVSDLLPRNRIMMHSTWLFYQVSSQRLIYRQHRKTKFQYFEQSFNCNNYMLKHNCSLNKESIAFVGNFWFAWSYSEFKTWVIILRLNLWTFLLKILLSRFCWNFVAHQV